MDEDNGRANPFDEIFARPPSPITREIWRAAFVDDYPEEAEPFSFVTLTELRQISKALRVGPGQVFADLACGRGGPGLWVARETGAALIGVDFSAVAVREAANLSQRFELPSAPTFRVGNLSATGLDDESLDAAMSVDAIQIAPDRGDVLREVRRIIRPGARFIFTTWEANRDAPDTAMLPGRQRVEDHRPLLESAGFEVERHEEPAGWRERNLAVFQGVLDRENDLRAEIDSVLADGMVSEARWGVENLAHHRRVLVVAVRRPGA